MAEMKYTFGRWQGSDAHAYMQIHGPSASLVGTINLANTFTYQESYNASHTHLKKYSGKVFKNHMDCLDHLNGEYD